MLTGLPSGERAVLELIALRVLCTVTQPHEYTETTVNAGIACRLYQEFTIQKVIRNSELSGVLNRKPKISRKIVLFFLITFKDFPIPSKNS